MQRPQRGLARHLWPVPVRAAQVRRRCGGLLPGRPDAAAAHTTAPHAAAGHFVHLREEDRRLPGGHGRDDDAGGVREVVRGAAADGTADATADEAANATAHGAADGAADGATNTAADEAANAADAAACCANAATNAPGRRLLHRLRQRHARGLQTAERHGLLPAAGRDHGQVRGALRGLLPSGGAHAAADAAADAGADAGAAV